MPLLCPRFHLFEIDDQPWFPPYLREKVQAWLTLAWTLHLPGIQPTSASQLVASVLSRLLSSSVPNYTFIDFCAGAGGPTPTIERQLNAQLAASAVGAGQPAPAPARFLLTDISPHREAWAAAAKRSDNLGYVPESVDAANAPQDLGREDGKKVFRLFNLAFHHFDDDLAERILRNTLEGADGFGIFELQHRTLSSFITVALFGVLILLATPIFYWRSPGQLFFTYLIPVIPFVLVFDGFVSSVRTRTPAEVLALVRGDSRLKGWNITSGSETHTWPTGELNWIVGIKK
ncbi:MAG: hypothetical protein M1825_003556 [Sarcosagium campestre]|nr:MAG: hypothetical protein M1825_003556 [Sarcosagium campestre]